MRYQIRHAIVKYAADTILEDVNFEIHDHEKIAIIGRNGCGKTTTMNCMLALLKYDKGSIKIFGEEMQPDSYDSKRKIGVVMQNVAVFDALNVYDNIDYFCGLYIKDKQLRRQYVEEAIEFVGLSDYKKFYPKKLSGGLLRRLNIACGIAHKPKLIFLDEPTVAVDPQSRNRILEGILELNRQGATIVYTSHYMEEVEQICTRIAIMDKGKNLATGTTDELKQMIKKKEIISIEILDISDEDILALKELKNVYDVTYENHKLTILCNNGKHNLIHILDYLQTKNLSFGRVYSELPTLNDVFLEMTGKELRD